MQVKDISISELREYENNPRKNDGAVQAVAESIKRFGFKVPCIVDRNNVIVCGHTRIKAAVSIGLSSVPCIIADDLTPEQIQAFRLADNKTGELSEWDFSALEKELEALRDFEIDMSDFGFYDFEEVHLDSLFNPPSYNKRHETKEENTHGEEKSDKVEEERQEKYILSIIFDSEEDASELIEFLDSEDYIYSFERG